MRLSCFFLVVFCFSTSAIDAQDSLSHHWDCYLECPGGKIRFGLIIDQKEKNLAQAWITNGTERISVPKVVVREHDVQLTMDHYDSQIVFRVQDNQLDGHWKKRRGVDKWVEMKFHGNKRNDQSDNVSLNSANRFAGKWSVDFAKSDDPAVGIFKSNTDGSIAGTFLTTTGDYRFLHGRAIDDGMELSCFDGAHAFLFRATINSDNSLSGDFWASTTWHEKWTAKRDDNARLPDAFRQTRLATDQSIESFAFPDLDGIPTRLNDPKFAAPVRIIYVFGSWCPNCHDAAAYFKELKIKFGDRLSILGLAFELTGEFDRDAAQVKKYLERNAVDYPVLVAGLSDKKLASQTVPFLDQVRSYPTTVFLDSRNNVRAIHTGFSGPATGDAYTELKTRFEKLIGDLATEK